MPSLDAVKSYLLDYQDRLCAAFEQDDDQSCFTEDTWSRPEGGGGRTRVLAEGNVFEKAGIAFSHVSGPRLPASATAHRPELADHPWEAVGVSLVIHPRNPHVPTSHANFRFFTTRPADPASPPVWWFGGGFDLTPYYGHDEDCIHWHRTAQAALAPFKGDHYLRWKQACDTYFFLKHRQESRGIGGLFFDDFNHPDFPTAQAVWRAAAEAYLPAYRPIVARRRHTPVTPAQRDWQLYRRGRYVEFNLVWDRGTLFGLQSGGRTESILMSLPPLVTFKYNLLPAPDSPEARLLTHYLPPRDWLLPPS